MTTHCGAHLEFIVALLDSVIFLNKAVAVTKSSGEVADILKSFEQINKILANSRVASLLQQAKTSVNARIEICNEFYSLNSPSFLQFVIDFFAKYTQKIDDIFKGLFELGRKNGYEFLVSRSLQAADLNNWNLDFASSPQQIFSDAIVDIVTDSLASSPIEGSEVNRGKPMNLSLIFP